MPRDPRAKALAIVDAAATTFARFGLKRTQMVDIAVAAGTALGTLYRYSRSKEALFGAALRRAFHMDEEDVLRALDDAEPSRSSIMGHVAEFVDDREFLPTLGAAVDARPPTDAAAELRSVVGEMFDVMNHFALAICLIDVSSREWPELGKVYDDGARRVARDQLQRYLEKRCRAGLLVEPPDLPSAAHFLLELCGEFTRGRKVSSPNRDFATDEMARATVLHIACRTFLPSL